MADLVSDFANSVSWPEASERAGIILAEADAAWRGGEVLASVGALRACDGALAGLGEGGGDGGDAEAAARVRFPDLHAPDWRRLVAALWLKRGHLLEALSASDGRVEPVFEALRSYDRALARLDADATERVGEAAAGAWMNRGNALQRLGGEKAVAEAARCYERTLALLDGLFTDDADALLRLALTRGAAWLNLGAARRAAADEGAADRGEKTASARDAFERAAAELEPWADRHAAARRNLAAAWTNLGLAREADDPAGAATAHADALRLAEGTAGERERAALLMNLGRARALAGEAGAGRAALREALRLLAPRERADAASAEHALRARHALCVALAADAPRDAAAAAEAAALADSGLALAGAIAGAPAWAREAASRLFEYGAWLRSERSDPGLAAWLEARLEPADPARLRAAWRAVERRRQEIVRRGFERLLGAEAGETGAELEALRALEERLRGLAAATQGGLNRA